MLDCFPSFQSDYNTETNDVQSQLEYPAKKQERGFTYFGNVFSIYLPTKNMGLHVHFKRNLVSSVTVPVSALPLCLGSDGVP